MGVIARLWVEVGADAKKFEAGIKGIQGKLTSLQNGFNKFGNIMTLGVTVPLIAAGKGMLDAGMQLEATEAKFNTVFKGMTDDATAFIMEFKKLTPLTIAEARGVASGIQDLLVPMGFAREEATELTGGFMHLIGALANFNNSTHTAQEVAAALSSALVGEYEPMRRLGVVTSKTAIDQRVLAMGLADTKEEITDQMRAIALLEIITESSADALAAYTEANLDAKTKMGLMKTEIIDVAAQLGVSLLPMIEKLVEWIRNLTEKFKGLTAEQQVNILKWIALAAAIGPASKIIAGIIGITKAFIGLRAAMVATQAATQTVTVAAAGGWQALGLYGSTAAATGGKLAALGTKMSLLAAAGGPVFALGGAFIAAGLITQYWARDTVRAVVDTEAAIEQSLSRSSDMMKSYIATLEEIPKKFAEMAKGISGTLATAMTPEPGEIGNIKKAFLGEMEGMLNEYMQMLESRRAEGVKALDALLAAGEMTPAQYANARLKLEGHLDDLEAAYVKGYNGINATVADLLDEQGNITEDQYAKIRERLYNLIDDKEQALKLSQIREEALRQQFHRAMAGDEEKSGQEMIQIFSNSRDEYLKLTEDHFDTLLREADQAYYAGALNEEQWVKARQSIKDKEYEETTKGLKNHLGELYKENQKHFNSVGTLYQASTGNLLEITGKSGELLKKMAGKNGEEMAKALADGLKSGEISWGDAARYMVDVIANTLEGGLPELREILKRHGYDTITDFTRALAAGKPKAVSAMFDIGVASGNGLGQGLNSTTGAVAAYADGMIREIIATASNAVWGAYEVGVGFGASFAAGIRSQIEAAHNAAAAIVQAAYAGAGTVKQVASVTKSLTPKAPSWLQMFDTGGVVPGPIGEPQLAIVHGGETVLPTHKAGWNGSGSENTIHHTLDLINVPATVDGASLERTLVEMLNSPQVKRRIDRIGYENQVSAVRGLGA